MVKISRYQNYCPSLPEKIKQDIYSRMRVLIDEEKSYCDKGNYEHMAQILGRRNFMKLELMCYNADIINYGELHYTDFVRT